VIESEPGQGSAFTFTMKRSSTPDAHLLRTDFAEAELSGETAGPSGQGRAYRRASSWPGRPRQPAHHLDDERKAGAEEPWSTTGPDGQAFERIAAEDVRLI